MMYRILIFISITLYTLVGLASQDSIDLRLKARGLQAIERLEKLIKKNGDSKGKKLTKKELCEWSYETIYYSFVHPELSKIVKRPAYQQLHKDSLAYLFLLSEIEGGLAFQMNYIYLKKTDSEPTLSEISTLKDGWRIKVSHTSPNIINVNSPNCFFQFNLKDPLDSTYDTMVWLENPAKKTKLLRPNQHQPRLVDRNFLKAPL